MRPLLQNVKRFFTLPKTANSIFLAAAFVFLAATVVRFILLIFFFNTDQSIFYDGDSWGYLQPALNLISGNGFSIHAEPPFSPESFRTPGYPFFLAVHFFFFGSFVSALFTQVTLSILTGYIILKLGIDYFSPRVGLVAAALFLVMPFSLLTPMQYTTLPLFISLLSLLVWFWLDFLRSHQFHNVWIVAVIVPVLIFVRPIALFIIVPLATSLVFAFSWDRLPKKMTHATIVLLGIFILGVSPWVARNEYVFNTAAFSSVPPFQLYFFEGVAFNANRNNLTFLESRAELESHIAVVTGKDFQTYRNEYIRFSSLTPILFREGIAIAIADPLVVFQTRIGQVHNFFARDGIRYWFERFEKDLNSKKGFAIELYEINPVKEGYVLWVGLERAVLYLLFFGFVFSVFIGFLRKKVGTMFLVLLVLYFAALSGVMSSAPFRYPVEPFLFLLGVSGFWWVVQFFLKRSSKIHEST